MSTAAAAELEEYPKYKANYIRAFDRMLKVNNEKGVVSKSNWKTAQDVYNWWLRIDESSMDDKENNDDFSEYWTGDIMSL